MKLTFDGKHCYYDCYYDMGNGKTLSAGVVFKSQESDEWFADSYDGSGESDYFSGNPFKTKEQAIEHIDQTMKAIFKRILDENT